SGNTEVCLFFLIFTVVSASHVPTLSNVIHTLERMISYYKNNYKEFNLDGIFGLRLLEGQVKLLIEDDNKGKFSNIPPQPTFEITKKQLLSKLQEFLHTAKNISDLSLPFVAKNNIDYFHNMKELVSTPYGMWRTPRRIDPGRRWSKDVIEKRELRYMSEELSDECMMELLGTGRIDKKKCIISDKCFKVMTTKGMQDYSVTHQLLWVMVAERMGCNTQLAEFFKSKNSNIDDHVLEFCTNNYFEMQEVLRIQKGIILPIYQDLFLEVQFVCPLFGFYQFLNMTYLQQILSWQYPNGCYGKMNKVTGVDPLAKRQVEKKLFREDVDDDNDEYDYNQNKGHQLLNNMIYDTKDDNKAKPADDLNIHKAAENQKVNMMQLANQQDPNANKAADDSFDDNSHNSPIDSPNIGFVQVDNKHIQMFGDQDNNVLNKQSEKAYNQAETLNRDTADHVNAQMRDSLNNKGNNNAVHNGNVDNNWNDPNMDDAKQIQDSYHVKDNPLVQTRRLLVEQTLEDGCLSHKTAVASGALIVYLRYMLELGPYLNDTTQLSKIEPIKQNGENDPGNDDDSVNLDEDNNVAAPDNGNVHSHDDDTDNNAEEEEDQNGEDEDEDKEQKNYKDDEDDNNYEEDEENGPNQKEQHKKLHAHRGLPPIPKDMVNNDLNTDDNSHETHDYYNSEKEDSNTANKIQDNSKHIYIDNNIHKIQDSTKHKNRDFHVDESHIYPGVNNTTLQPSSLMTYLVILPGIGVMFVMYKFIKRRRIRIRYRSVLH
ncbi:unnamed protein product, partial [Owenia fusiformis]